MSKSEMVRQAHHPEPSRRAISNFQNHNDQNRLDYKMITIFLFETFEHLNFRIVSDFEIRTSNLS